MTVAVLADATLKNEFAARAGNSGQEIVWADSMRSLTIIEADIYFDLLFTMDRERLQHLRQLAPAPVLVNSVAFTTAELGGDLIRINAWPTLLQREVAEIAVARADQRELLQLFLEQLGWTACFVPDEPGMITPRILAMIINEAYYTLGDDVSTREEIDLAMQLGTNYPLGPFAWSEKIGLHRVYELLKLLSVRDNRYNIAPSLSARMSKG